MTRSKSIILIVGILLLLTSYTAGQGCSDAGVCTINSFKPNADGSNQRLLNQVKIGFAYGNADNSISVIGNYIEYNRHFNDQFGIDIKLTSISQKGNGISVFGLSDIFLSANYRVNKVVKIIFGTKIPFSKANKSQNDLPLPMDYQSSLGTFDLIFGIGVEIEKIQIVAAWQQPVTQNVNQFFSQDYPSVSKMRDFQSTNQFKRSGDVLLRVSYPIFISEKLKLMPSFLPIYHLANDRYTDRTNTEREIVGSQGLTLNGNVYLDYEINEKNAIQLNVGIPFVVRDERPDGLTRRFTANIEYRIVF